MWMCRIFLLLVDETLRHSDRTRSVFHPWNSHRRGYGTDDDAERRDASHQANKDFDDLSLVWEFLQQALGPDSAKQALPELTTGGQQSSEESVMQEFVRPIETTLPAPDPPEEQPPEFGDLDLVLEFLEKALEPDSPKQPKLTTEEQPPDPPRQPELATGERRSPKRQGSTRLPSTQKRPKVVNVTQREPKACSFIEWLQKKRTFLEQLLEGSVSATDGTKRSGEDSMVGPKGTPSVMQLKRQVWEAAQWRAKFICELLFDGCEGSMAREYFAKFMASGFCPNRVRHYCAVMADLEMNRLFPGDKLNSVWVYLLLVVLDCTWSGLSFPRGRSASDL